LGREAAEQKETNQLKAFSLMLKNAIIPAERQSEYIDMFIAELVNKPGIFPGLK